MEPVRRPLFRSFPWEVFALSEGVGRALQLGFLVALAGSAFSGAHIWAGLCLVGLVLILGGVVINRRSRYQIVPGSGYIVGSIVIGALAVYSIVATLFIFSVSSLSFSFLLLVGALWLVLDRLILTPRYGRLTGRSLVAAILCVAAPFVFLGQAPAVVGDAVWVALSLPVVHIVSDLINRRFRVSVISPWVHNFWQGVALCGVSLGFLVIVYREMPLGLVVELPGNQLALLIGLGAMILATVFARQRTFMYGGSVAAKKVLSIVSYVVVGLALAGLLLAESITGLGVVAFVLVAAAYWFLDPTITSQFRTATDKTATD